jgi:ArsR family metal-binding transcriptional regulator
MLISEYELEVFTPPCDPGAPRFAAKAHFKIDIREVLPYLNATLEGAEYNPAAPSLRWRKADHLIVFHPLEIAASNISDRSEAKQEIRELIEVVNTTWDGRSEIEPSGVVRRRPSHLALFKLLPVTNCKACGELTCYNFALKVAVSQRALDDCPVLLERDYAEQRAELEALIIDA